MTYWWNNDSAVFFYLGEREISWLRHFSVGLALSSPSGMAMYILTGHSAISECSAERQIFAADV